MQPNARGDSPTSTEPHGSATPGVASQIHALGPWFHNLDLRAEDGTLVQTAPNHFLGDFPSSFWHFFRDAIPQDLTGWSVLDIGCNGGFYSFEMKRRGATRVLGVDHDARYLRQAEFARANLGYTEREVEFRQVEAYEIDRLLPERFDLVIFMGVLYHLKHPLFALEKVASLVKEDGLMLFQTMERGSGESRAWEEDYPISEREVFFDDAFPRMYFVEHRYAGDPTNWWIPNPAATQAMLRTVGMQVQARPCVEVYVCRRQA
ncbi:MAG: TIGR04290 family methyltransferase [Chloroflexi bacterium]|nr:TIGR04290 family methyltransferase [Chloroflexota bacterium]